MTEGAAFFPDARMRTSSVEFRLEDGLVIVVVKARQVPESGGPWTDCRLETAMTTEQFAQAANALLRQATQEAGRG